MSQINQLREKLFQQMESLSSCSSDDIESEIKRSKSLAEVGTVIVDTFKVEVDFFKSLPTSSKHDSVVKFLEDDSQPSLKILPHGEQNPT